MIPVENIRRYHAFVPVMYWPVLWVSLVRLWLFLEACHREGRNGVLTALTRDGRIIITHVGDSASERAARCALGEDFDRTPWTRLAPLAESGLWAVLGAGFTFENLTRLPQDSCDTATTPLAHRVSTPLEPP